MKNTTTDPIILNDRMIRRYQIEYGLVNKSSPAGKAGCNEENFQNDSQTAQLSIEVQKSVSRLNIIMTGTGALPAVLAFIILGATCDRIGRRPLLILPCTIGRIIRPTIIILIVELNLSDIWFIIANIVDGLFGSNNVLPSEK
ncbi:unnamed protein product [Rotaria magnacalcarata]|uniref:Uncharacterized protein n=1 Tax=Rotaria magnacalcarata TaxID=392030 RepID=A0A816X4D3_9BILA|nr:unnamed protein product [Rotaria magnacalcarata]CAF1674767.1 unnamed protein product [Rotaria magnacalcarata]CAF2142608.1 unnamed protein product [Rotaria magnacalcarata]CAF4064732.1 unnamed protein product [Rotaria magnacalcarata]CAF5191907.1 unnamed protein product [Rotaria magnacalcarata]